MKQLICEMCGSTDLLKDGGVFVCQSCGCKYSVEEAKKMMIDGIVEVSGTVKVDDTEKIDNYLVMSQTAYDSGNGQSAFDYANKALEISPKNTKAWIAKMKSIEYISTLGELKLMEVVEAGKNAVAFAEEAYKKDVTFEVYSYEAHRSLELLKLATNKMADTDDIKKTYKQFCLISLLSATQYTMDADSGVVQLYDNIASEALAMIQLIPDEVLSDFPEIAGVVRECAKQYEKETNALNKRFSVYGAELLESAKKARHAVMMTVEDKAKKAEKIELERKAKEQAERNAQYWELHQEEKINLEKEKAELVKEIDILTQSIEKLPETIEVERIKNQIETLKKEKNSLGFFQGKEKKALGDQIFNLNVDLVNASSAKNNAVTLVQSNISKLKSRIREIKVELTKDR